MTKSKQLTLEVIEKMNQENLEKFIPGDSVSICRYMNLTKFMSLLVENELFFTRADKFEDPLEGEVPEEFLKRLFWHIDSSISNNFSDFFRDKLNVSSEQDRQDILNKLDYLENANSQSPEITLYRSLVKSILLDKDQEKAKVIEQYKKKRLSTFISCWAGYEEKESYAHWKIYSEKYGVAILTTVKKLKEVTNAKGAELFKVRYLDGKSELNFIPREAEEQGKLNLFRDYNFFVLKRPEYQYENEIRAILSNLDGEYQVIKVADLSKFIDKIIVSPFAEEWFAQMVRKIADKYGLENVEVIKSSVRIKG